MTNKIEFNRAMFEWPKDTKTVRKNGRPKQVVIDIKEKKEELWKILYTSAKDQKNKRKSMTNDEIIKTLNIKGKIYEKYPNTSYIEEELISNGLAGKIKQL